MLKTKIHVVGPVWSRDFVFLQRDAMREDQDENVRQRERKKERDHISVVDEFPIMFVISFFFCL